MGCLGKTGAEKGRLKRSEEEEQEIGKRIIKRYVSFHPFKVASQQMLNSLGKAYILAILK